MTDLSYKNSPKPGPIRQFLIAGLCAILMAAGIASSVVSYRQRQQVLRGWQNAATINADLPPRGPLAGVNVELTQYHDQALSDALDQIAATGMTWVRQIFRWSDIESTPGTFDFSRYDVLVNAVAAHPTLQLVAVIDESPAWARHAGAEGNRFAPPADPAQFSTFAGKLAARYADKIRTYQVWDEPNLADQWGGLDPTPTLYFAMLRGAYEAIHAAVPQTTVIAAALAPTVEHGPRNVSDIDYLTTLYTLGAQPYFDAAAAKPYGFNSSPDDRTVGPDILNFSRIVLIREVMQRFGDSAKPLWGSNFGWNSLPNDWTNAPSVWGQVTGAQQEAYIRAAYQRASREWPWIGGLILEHWQPAAANTDPIQGFAIRDHAPQWITDGVFPAGAADSLSGNGRYTMADPRLQYSGPWRTGPLGADPQPGSDAGSSTAAPSTVSVVIDGGTSGGKTVALQVRRGDYVAYLYPTLDGQPVSGLPHDPDGQAYLLLTSPDRLPQVQFITIIPNLPPGRHTLSIRAYLGYDHYPLESIALGTAPATRDDDVLFAGGLFLTVIGLIGTIGFGRGLPWDRLTVWRGVIVGYTRRMRGLTATVLVSIVTAAGVLLTWGGALPNVFRRDPPTLLLTALTAGLIYFSPAFLLTAASLLVLFVIIYNRPAFGLALVVFWIPFFLFPVQLYLTAAPMVEISLIVTTLALTVRAVIGWLGSLKQPGRPSLSWHEIRLQPLDWAVVALVGIALVTLTWSEQRAPALRELRTMILEPALFYALLRLTKLTQTDVLRLVDTLLIAALLVCVIGFSEYFHIAGTGGVIVAEQGSQRLASVYGSPNNVALFLGRCLPFAVAMALFPLTRPRRIAAAALAVTMLAAVLLTQSVGAVALGLPAGLLVVLLAWNLRIGALITVGIGALGAVGLVILPKFVPRLQGALDGTRASSFVRTELWQSTINLLRERPLTGAGLDQFLYLYRSRYILPDAWREPDLSHPHNFFLDYWVSLGFAGVLLLIAMQAAFWTSAIRVYRRARKADPLLAALVVGAMGSMADFLAHGLVDNSYFVVDLSFVFCLTLALVGWLRRGARY